MNTHLDVNIKNIPKERHFLRRFANDEDFIGVVASDEENVEEEDDQDDNLCIWANKRILPRFMLCPN